MYVLIVDMTQRQDGEQTPLLNSNAHSTSSHTSGTDRSDTMWRSMSGNSLLNHRMTPRQRMIASVSVTNILVSACSLGILMKKPEAVSIAWGLSEF